MQINDLIDRVEKLEGGFELARDLRKFVNKRRLGLVYEESKPEYVRLTSKPVVEGDLVNVLPPRGTMEDMSGDDEADDIWVVDTLEGGSARLVSLEDERTCNAAYEDLVAVARFDQTIYCGLSETGRVERGGDKPYHTVINGENYHALELMLFPYFQSVDCIYIDPPYNTGDKSWKYNNNYVAADDAYRHSKWLTFMEDRLRLAKKLLNPTNSVLIVTIDEKEYLRLGLLLEQLFPDATIQMVSSVINPSGVARGGQYARTDEYLFFVQLGTCRPSKLPLAKEWRTSKKTTTDEPTWRTVRRRGSHDTRVERPNSFFPIFIMKKTGKIVSCGQALDIQDDYRDVVSDDPEIEVVFPLKPDGTEGCWQIGAETISSLLDKGYVRCVSRNKWGWIPTYLASGEAKKVESGIYDIVGRGGANNEIQVASASDTEFVPGSQWRIPSHNAREYGSNLLANFIGKKRFSYPKSLYAVEDTLQFYLSDNPHALIVDFFAGSATTVHAVMRLNHRDNGRRRCIAVTNNEVSYEEATRFAKQGLRQGDEEWERFGIARYVAIPRVIAAITGIATDGNPVSGDYGIEDEDYQVVEGSIEDPETGKKLRGKYYRKAKMPAAYVTDPFPMADGFEENAVFYDLKYLEPSVITANLAFDEIAPLLWMRSGSVGPVITLGDTDPEEATFEVTDAYGVLFDYAWAPEFIEGCRARDVDHIFVVTDVDRQYRDLCAEFRGKDVKQLYKSYLRSFEIGQDR